MECPFPRVRGRMAPGLGAGGWGWPRGIWPVLCPKSPPVGHPCESVLCVRLCVCVYVSEELCLWGVSG